MPFIDVTIHPSVSPEQARRIGDGMTSAMATIMRKRADLTAVCIRDLPGATWTIGAAPPPLPTAYVEVKVTEGTNSAEEKTRLVAHLHALLSETLGGLAEASYIVIHEVPAGNWGYGGRLQTARMPSKSKTSMEGGA